MKMIEHHFDLYGPGCYGKYSRPEAIGAVLSRVVPTARESVRMGILRSSRRIGRPMRKLAAAWNVKYAGQSAGPEKSTRLHFTAPTLGKVAPQLFKQGLLWDDTLHPDDTAFDLMTSMISDIAQKNKESVRFDADLLDRVAHFETALRKGVERIHLSGHRLETKSGADINKDVTAAARVMFEETPCPRRVRVAGLFDMLRISDRVFELVLKDGQRLRAVWCADTVARLKDYLDKQVVLDGEAVFRPSGSLLRVNTNAIEPADEKDLFFSEIPRPSAEASVQSALLKPQTAQTGINAVWGRWPGEESEEELLAALKEVD